MDENVGFCVDDIIYRPEEIIVHLLLAEIHAGLRIEAAEGGEAQVGVGDVDEFRWLFDYGFLSDIREEGSGGKM
jgi:hypothetical protein